MMPKLFRKSVWLLALVPLALAGCGGSSTSSNTITPGPATITNSNGPLQFQGYSIVVCGNVFRVSEHRAGT